MKNINMKEKAKECIRHLMIDPFECFPPEYAIKEWWKMANCDYEYALEEALQYIKNWKRYALHQEITEDWKTLCELNEKELVSLAKEVLNEFIEKGNEIYKNLLNLTQEEKELLVNTIKEVIINDDKITEWIEYQDTGYDFYNLAAHAIITWKLAVTEGKIDQKSLTPMQKLIHEFPITDLYFFGFLQTATQKVKEEVLK